MTRASTACFASHHVGATAVSRPSSRWPDAERALTRAYQNRKKKGKKRGRGGRPTPVEAGLPTEQARNPRSTKYISLNENRHRQLSFLRPHGDAFSSPLDGSQPHLPDRHANGPRGPVRFCLSFGTEVGVGPSCRCTAPSSALSPSSPHCRDGTEGSACVLQQRFRFC